MGFTRLLLTFNPVNWSLIKYGLYFKRWILTAFLERTVGEVRQLVLPSVIPGQVRKVKGAGQGGVEPKVRTR